MEKSTSEASVSQNFFKTWEYSLFVDFSNEEIQRLRTMDMHKDMRYTDANFTAAVMLLKKENATAIEQFIDHALEKNPESIHAWCNRGLFSLKQRPPRYEEARGAAVMINRLLQERKPNEDAQLEQAYWLHSYKRSPESREKALLVFHAVLSTGQPHPFSYHYYYAKMLNSERKVMKPLKDRKRVAQLIVDQLTILVGSEDKTYELEMWRFLAELHGDKTVWKELHLSSLLHATRCESIDLLLCANKMVELINSEAQIQIYSNVYAKVGKIFLQHSLCLSNKEERVEVLNRALEYGKKSLETRASPVERGPNLCAEIYMWKWAIQYYEEHKADVESYVQRMDSPYKVFPSDGNAMYWSYLIRCYYPTKPDNSLTTRPHLEKAKSIIQDAMVPGCRSAPIFYPRVLMLLGEKQNVVELSFNDIWLERSKEVLNESDKGMFYEMIGNLEEARRCYQKVINKNWYHHQVSYRTARNGLRRVSEVLD